MKSRWLLNLALLLVVAGVALFLYFAPKQKAAEKTALTVSQVSPSVISKISIEFPAKNPILFEKRDGHWNLTQPYPARAGQFPIDRVLSVLAADSVDKFDAADPARFGLDNPSLRLKLDAEEIAFGTFNPVNGQQYIGYKNSVYLISSGYSESASIQLVEFLDKSLLGPAEKIAGFDFSRLEQWEEVGGLRLDQENGTWKASLAGAKPSQDGINQWYDEFWRHLSATSVEPYKVNPKATYPSFEIKLANGKTIHVDKQQESPEMILARPDEGLLYRLPQDVGFSLLNPPVNPPKH
jgi:hypothetical protein